MVKELLMQYENMTKDELVERLKQQEFLAEKTDQRLKQIMNCIGDPMFVKDEESRLLLVNEAFCSIFGLSRESIIGKTLAEDVPENEREHFLRIDKQVLADGIENLCEERLTVRGGETRTILTRKNRFIDDQGEKFLVGIIHDITELKKKKEALDEARRQAVEANQAKTDFLANMSHEMRTPLTTITGFSELLKNCTSEEKRMKYIHLIQKNSRHLHQLVDDILDLAKIEARKVDLENVRFSFMHMLHEVFTVFKHQADEKKIEFKAEFKGELPLYIRSDETRLRQILFNIISNAIKFTSEGKVEVKVRVAKAVTEGKLPALEFIVKDTGCGIPEDQQSKLFKAFSQADSSTTREYGGTGLGLVLANKFAEAMGGSVTLLESSPANGSTFVIQVTPEAMFDFTQIADIEQSLPQDDDELLNEKKNKQLAGIRILVVDDNPEVQTLINNVLTQFGAKFEFANNGEEAVRRAEKGHLDVILMDIQMPKMDGVKATQIIRKSGNNIPIIAVSASVMKEDYQRILQAGCNDFISKPINFHKIVDMIEKRVNRSGG